MNDEARRRSALEQSIAEYHDVTRAEVLETIAYLRDPGDSVVAGGSLALGLGNHLSDLDVIVAGRESIDTTRMPLEHFVKSLRIDVCKLDQDAIDRIFERARGALDGDAPLHGSFGDVDHETDLKLLHRVAFGIHWDGPPLGPSTGHHQAVARDLVVREYAERMRESIFLAQLGARVGRSLAGVLNARLGVEQVLQATIVARGLPFAGDKWLEERLLDEAKDLVPTYQRFAFLPEPDTGAETYVAAAVECCQHMTGTDLVLGTLAVDAAWDGAELRFMRVGDNNLLLSVKHGAIWYLDDREVAAWAELTGGGSADGPAEQLWPCGDLSEDQAHLCFSMHENGVLRLRWSRGMRPRDLAIEGAVAR
jgi:hypothetical protein